MPKLQGPMMSLRASGTFARLITFEDRGIKQRARALPSHAPPQTPLQTAYATKVSVMAAGWSNAAPTTRQAWRIAAGAGPLNGYTLWWREWFAQTVEPPNEPNLP